MYPHDVQMYRARLANPNMSTLIALYVPSSLGMTAIFFDEHLGQIPEDFTISSPDVVDPSQEPPVHPAIHCSNIPPGPWIVNHVIAILKMEAQESSIHYARRHFPRPTAAI